MRSLYQPFQPTLTEPGLNRFGLAFVATPPCAVLRGIVHSYLQISAAAPTPYPVIPDGMQALYISPAGVRLAGALTQACDVPILEAGEYFGIRFYPGALRHFFNLDLGEITDQFVESCDLPGSDIAVLSDSIYQHASFQARAQVCEQWLLKRFDVQSVSRFDLLLSLVYRSKGDIKISQLSEAAGWSSRHLNRLFHRYTGLNAKGFVQVMRMQQACRQLLQPASDSLRVALESGFYDQAHLIKSCQKQLGSTPAQFINRFRSDFYNH